MENMGFGHVSSSRSLKCPRNGTFSVIWSCLSLLGVRTLGKDMKKESTLRHWPLYRDASQTTAHWKSNCEPNYRWISTWSSCISAERNCSRIPLSELMKTVMLMRRDQQTKTELWHAMEGSHNLSLANYSSNSKIWDKDNESKCIVWWCHYTRTYFYAFVAAEFGLHGKLQRNTVGVLNDKTESFETMPVEFQMESVDSRTKTEVDALTADKVIGDMCVINLRKYQNKWNHLRGLEFSGVGRHSVVDKLIGMEQSEFHNAY